MTEIRFYGLAELDADGRPVKYLPFLGESYDPAMKYSLTPDPAMAWTFADRDSAQEVADVLNSVPRNRHLKVIELPAEG